MTQATAPAPAKDKAPAPEKAETKKAPAFPPLPDEKQLKTVAAGVKEIGAGYAVRVEKEGRTERYTALLNGEEMSGSQARALRVIRRVYRAQTSRPDRRDYAIEFSENAPHIVAAPKLAF